MRVTRFGRDYAQLNLGYGAVTQIPPGGPSGTVPTSDGSNGIYFGPNVSTITSNGSNLVAGPFVNFAAGSNIILAVSSNTINIASTPGGGGGSTDLPWSYAQADGGLVGDGVTNDTAAFQAWITSITASGTQSGWFWFEPGVYLISGALADTGAFNGQVLLPNVSTSNPQITLTFQGAARPPFAYHGTAIDGSYAVIKSSLSGASGTASVISGGNSGQNNIEVVVRDLVCLAPDNPTFTFWNLATTQGGRRDGLFISTTGIISAASVTQPTNSNAYGIKLPGANNSNLTLEDTICVYGFYTGVLHGELGQANYITSLTMVGVEVPTSPHSGGHIRHQMTASPTGIKFTGAANYLDIWYDAEHCNPAAGGPYNPAWAVTINDVDDGSNLMHGHIRWFCVQAGVGRDGLFTVNGGSNILYEEIGAAPAGYVTVKDEGSTLATGGISLDFVGSGVTASGTGAAKTVTISGAPTGSAGGDLSGTYPNPSVVDDSHSHTTATAPGGGSELLILDTPAGSPLVFADILQNEAGTALLYADP